MGSKVASQLFQQLSRWLNETNSWRKKPQKSFFSIIRSDFRPSYSWHFSPYQAENDFAHFLVSDVKKKSQKKSLTQSHFQKYFFLSFLFFFWLVGWLVFRADFSYFSKNMSNHILHVLQQHGSVGKTVPVRLNWPACAPDLSPSKKQMNHGKNSKHDKGGPSLLGSWNLYFGKNEKRFCYQNDKSWSPPWKCMFSICIRLESSP